ncbi:MAG: CopM family metallochaperone [Dongiaceae bacterium]
MSILLRRVAAPTAGLLLLIGLGLSTVDSLAQDADNDSDVNVPIAKSLDEAAMQIQRLRHQMRRLEREIRQMEQTMSGAIGMMGRMPMQGQMPMMGQGMMGQNMMGMPGQMPMQGMGMMGQMPMMGHMPMQGMGMMGQMPMMGMPGQMSMMDQGMGMSSDPVTQALQEAGHRMHHGMKAALTGNPDRDFVASMIPHHQGAVEMAEIVLKHGSDPEVKKLAEAIIAAQKAEIAQMEDWLKNHPQ